MNDRPVFLKLFVSVAILASTIATSSAGTIALLTGEHEYGTGESLPAFAKAEIEPLGHKIVHIAAPEEDGQNTFTNIDALPHADLVIVSVRRRAPQAELMDALRRHLASGKPVVGIRTASHAFELRKKKPDPGHAEWPTFDTAVLGGDYLGHYENKAGKGPATVVKVVPEQATHPIVAGLKEKQYSFTSHLYKYRNLAHDAEVLLRGSIGEDGKENEPVAWTHMAGESRVFYTSLGSQEDFKSPVFRQVLKNGILWALAEGANPKWGNWVEPSFPFFSSVLDARDIPGAPKDNLTPRGLVLPLGQDCWTCIDLDLLRVAAVWRGKGVTPRAMAPGSYHAAGTKTLEGQRDLPKPDGKIWLVNGLYPGAQTGDTLKLSDPRDPTPMETEPGRGALDPAKGRFLSVRAKQGGAELVYEVAGVGVTETWSSGEGAGIERRIERGPAKEPLVFALGRVAEGSETLNVAVDDPAAAELIEVDGVRGLRVKPSDKAVTIRVAMALGNEPKFGKAKSDPTKLRWPEEIITRGELSKESAAYVLDDIPLPIENPWRRNVRVSDIGFFKNGTAAVLTFDGDVWLVRGLEGNLDNVRWKRFTSGLHEPLSLVVHQEKVMVFDRNGLWRLHDTNGDGEADEHELFSNVFAQTAETREFSNSFRVAPDGSFIISKGGQQGGSLGKHNGMILRVSPDGKKLEVLAHGLRQPFIGVHPRTGLITSSDQQGNYVPSTPLHIIGGDRFYGFIPPFLPKEKYPAQVEDPLTWIPHVVNASAATQVWLADAKMGPLNDGLIHLGYNRPEIFLVRMHERASRRPHAAVISMMRDIPFGLLNGTVNPNDGQLYVAGFKVFGCSAPRISGLARLRYTGKPSTLPREVVAMDKGVLLRFDEPVDEASITPASFVVQRWNYRRSVQYGSPHLKLDGTPGQETMPVASAYLSRDKRSVLIGVPDMKPVMQMTVYWKLESQGAPFEHTAAFTPHELVPFDSSREGFGAMNVDLAVKAAAPAPSMAATAAEPSAAEGRKLYEMLGCIACHSTDGSMAGKVGPSWRGLAGARREMSDGSMVDVDDAYLRESILQPSAKVPKGFQNLDAGMPIYEGVLNETQIRSLILYIKSLGDMPTASVR